MSDTEKPGRDGSHQGDVDTLLSDLLVELKKATIPGRIDELARKLQEQLDRLGKKTD